MYALYVVCEYDLICKTTVAVLYKRFFRKLGAHFCNCGIGALDGNDTAEHFFCLTYESRIARNLYIKMYSIFIVEFLFIFRFVSFFINVKKLFKRLFIHITTPFCYYSTIVAHLFTKINDFCKLRADIHTNFTKKVHFYKVCTQNGTFISKMKRFLKFGMYLAQS